jgi:UDP-N-acetylmuramyl pentapeptide phosphotransferase/UDP-N-acetylglucosamine-1-phosphate transferase
MSNTQLLLFSGFISYISTRFLIKPLKKLSPDIPNERSSHKKITPRGGGIAIIISSSIFFTILGQYEFLYLSLLSLTCFLDDIKPINIKYKFFSQLITVFILFYNSNIKSYLFQSNSIYLDILFLILLIFLGCTIINFSNFFDGIDGLLCSEMMIILIFSSTVITSSIIPLLGAIIGFLIWNWSPAKIFLGDVGSNYLGGYLVFILFNTTSIIESLNLLILCSPILFDCSFCIVRRFLKKENIFEAHSLHLFQRLVKAGWKHSMVSVVYALLVALIGFSWLWGGLKWELISSLGTLFTLVLFDKFYADEFKV